MRIPQIRLEQTYAKLGIDITKPKQTIRQPEAEMNIHQEQVKVEIQRTPAVLEIDQTQAWNDQNLKNVFTLTRDMANDAYQKALKGISRRAMEGDRLAALEHKGTPIPDMAEENSSSGPAEFNVGFIPSHGSVRLHFTPGDLQMNWKRGGVTIDAQTNQPVHDYTPGNIERYLKQKESLSIDFTGLAVDLKL